MTVIRKLAVEGVELMPMIRIKHTLTNIVRGKNNCPKLFKFNSLNSGLNYHLQKPKKFTLADNTI